MKNLVKECRKSQGISQAKLSEMSGVNRTTISDLETGKPVSISTKTIGMIANALDVPADEIFFF